MHDDPRRRRFLFSMTAWSIVASGGLAAACAPTVRVEAPEKPIEINLNIRIDQEIRVKIDRDLEEVFDANSDIF